MERLLEAHAAIEEVAGEGPIAFPELQDSLRRLSDVSDEAAVELACAALRHYWATGRLTIHRGRALDAELPELPDSEAVQLIEDRSFYRYGDGDEVRAWFSAAP